VCGEVEPGQIDAREFACGPLDDLAVAMTGMHPRDVWVTRLESALPRAALADDLQLTPVNPQAGVENWHTAQRATNNSCPLASAPVMPPRDRGARSQPGRKQRRDMEVVALALVALGLGLSRRFRRPLLLVKAPR
jgi:hypothetical protein